MRKIIAALQMSVEDSLKTETLKSGMVKLSYSTQH